MNDSTTKPLPKVSETMDDLRHFDSDESALAYLLKVASETSDFETVPVIGKGASIGADEKGNPSLILDPEVFTDSMRITVKMLTKRVYVEKDGVSKFDRTDAKCIVIAPQPTLESLLDSTEARDWLQKIIDKELTHVMVRPLRDAENVEAVAESIPSTLTAYITTSRQSGGLLDTFNAHWEDLLAVFSEQIPALAKTKIRKADFRKALESKGFADAYFSHLENYGPEDISIFAAILEAGIEVATDEGDDPAIFQNWLDSRDDQVIEGEGGDESEPDLASIMGKLKAKKADADKPAEGEAADVDTDEGDSNEGDEDTDAGDEDEA